MVASMSSVKRPFVCLLLLIAAACADAATETPLDDAARNYVRMALEIGTHEKTMVDAYGPPEWKTEAESIRVVPELDRNGASKPPERDRSGTLHRSTQSPCVAHQCCERRGAP
jgi:hypothetical protein